jgi:hypothetical protein
MVTGAFAQYDKELKEVITLDVPYGKVTFSHKKHIERIRPIAFNKMKYECTECHHTWNKGEITGKLCEDCHKVKAEGKIISAKDAYHKDCIGCHEKAKKASKLTGPTGCTQCHVKAKK